MVARGVLAVMAVMTLMGLAACGTATAGGAGAGHAGHSASTGPGASQSAAAAVKASDGTVCADTQGVDQVEVGRTSSSRQVTLSGAIQVRALATALCALPAMPSGQSCPATSGDSVRLVFADGQQDFPPVSIQESGCRGVTGVGPVRSWSASSQFGQLLSEAAGGVGRLNPGTHPSSVPIGP
jgi:hypothetical protein